MNSFGISVVVPRATRHGWLALIAGLLSACGGGPGVPGNQAPVARITASAVSGLAPLSVTLSASESSDPDGGGLNYAWYVDGAGLPASQTSTLSQVFATAGEHSIRLAVQDIGGLTGSSTQLLQVLASDPPGIDPPVLSLHTGSRGLSGGQVSLALVQGLPAVAWYEQSSGLLRYLQAADSQGSSWRAAVTIYTAAPGSAGDVALAVVAGQPAAAFASVPDGTVRYARALDAAGTGWAPSVVVGSGAGTRVDIDLLDLDGLPAVFYLFEGALQKVTFASGQDADGADWHPLRRLGTANVSAMSAASVDGVISVAYADGSMLRYARAEDVLAPFAIQDVYEYDGDSGLALADSGGLPLIAHGALASGSDGYNILVTLGSDAAGTAFSAPAALETGEQSTGIFDVHLLVQETGQALASYDSGSQLGLSTTALLPGGWSALPNVQRTVISESSLLGLSAGSSALAYWDYANGALKYQYFE